MDKAERKQLKEAGKAKVVVTELERGFKANTSRVLPKEIVGESCLLNPVEFDWSLGYLPVPGYYISCNTCGDLLPMIADRKLQCRCAAVAIVPGQTMASAEPARVRVVKLIGKVSDTRVQRPKKWWKLW